jgi:hypothetical protein
LLIDRWARVASGFLVKGNEIFAISQTLGDGSGFQQHFSAQLGISMMMNGGRAYAAIEQVPRQRVVAKAGKGLLKLGDRKFEVCHGNQGIAYLQGR